MVFQNLIGQADFFEIFNGAGRLKETLRGLRLVVDFNNASEGDVFQWGSALWGVALRRGAWRKLHRLLP